MSKPSVEFTPSSDGDSPILPELLGQIPEGEKIGTVTADGAYDGYRQFLQMQCREFTDGLPPSPSGP